MSARLLRAPQLVEVFDDVKEVGVLYQKDAVDVYVIFGNEAAALRADANRSARPVHVPSRT